MRRSSSRNRLVSPCIYLLTGTSVLISLQHALVIFLSSVRLASTAAFTADNQEDTLLMAVPLALF